MPTALNEFDRLTNHIDGLEPAAIESDLKPFLGNDGHGAFSAALIRYPLDPANPEDPMVKLMGSVRGAVERIPTPRVRDHLGSNALDAYVLTFTSDEFHPDSFEAVELLAEQAGRFVDLAAAEEPGRKSYMLKNVSEAMTEISPSDEVSYVDLFTLANEYLYKAADAAREERPHRYSAARLDDVAVQAAENFQSLNKVILAAREDSHSSAVKAGELLSQTRDLSVTLYQEAIAVAADEEEPRATLETTNLIIKLIAETAGKVGPVSVLPASENLYGQLISLAATEIDKMLVNQHSLGPWEYGSYLTDLASSLAETVSEEYPSGDERAEVLETRIVALFKAARDGVQDVESLDENDIMAGEYSGGASAAAVNLAEGDFAKAQELLDIAFDLAVSEGRMGESTHRRPLWGLLRSVRKMAEGMDHTSAFELFKQLHKRLDERGQRGLMTDNADNWLAHVQQADETYALPELDDAGRSLIEYAIKDNDRIRDLRDLDRILGNEPELQEQIKQKIAAIRAQRVESNKEPQSQTDRLGRELVRALSEQQD